MNDLNECFDGNLQGLKILSQGFGLNSKSRRELAKKFPVPKDMTTHSENFINEKYHKNLELFEREISKFEDTICDVCKLYHYPHNV